MSLGRGSLRVIRCFDPWKSPLCTCPSKYSLNPYTGCAHGCLYCYARTYIGDFDRPRPKRSLIQDVLKDVGRVPRRAIISVSDSSDPYTPPENRLGLTRRVLKLLLSNHYMVLVNTKSDLVVRDADVMRNSNVVVAMTVTTDDDELARRLEPHAPPPSERVKALNELSSAGIPTVVRVDPIIPFINDDESMLKRLVRRLANVGVAQIVTSTLKIRGDILTRLCRGFPEVADNLRKLYAAGERFGSYVYLPRDIRLKYVMTLKVLAESEGLAFSSCREGFNYLSTPGIYCDGSTYLYNR